MNYNLHLTDEDMNVEYLTDIPLRTGDEIATCGKRYRVGIIKHILFGDGVSREHDITTVPLIRIAGSDE